MLSDTVARDDYIYEESKDRYPWRCERASPAGILVVVNPNYAIR